MEANIAIHQLRNDQIHRHARQHVRIIPGHVFSSGNRDHTEQRMFRSSFRSGLNPIAEHSWVGKRAQHSSAWAHKP
jgi:hypothetical protein